MHPYARRLLDSASGAIAADAPSLAFAADVTSLLASNRTLWNPPPDPPNADENTPSSQFSPSMAIIVVILLSAFFFMAFFSVYVRRCASDDEFNQPAGRRQRSAQGLDHAMVESLPMVKYSADKLEEDNDSSGCVVCLTDFEDGELLRSLPKCQHCFHPACIDSWLNSHITCPMCRRSLLPDNKEASDRGGSNRGLATRNEDSARGEATVAIESGEVQAGWDASNPEVATAICDVGTEQSGSIQDMHPREGNMSIAQFGTMRESDVSRETSIAPSPFQSRQGDPRSGLRRSNSTGHFLVRAFNRANCLVPAGSDDLGRPLSSGVPIAASTTDGLHRSRSQTLLPPFLVNRGEEMEEESELSAMRQDSFSRGWNFSFKRGFSLRRNPEEALATTVGESSNTSVRRTFDRLPV